jgi:hypothetical protein
MNKHITFHRMSQILFELNITYSEFKSVDTYDLHRKVVTKYQFKYSGPSDNAWTKHYGKIVIKRQFPNDLYNLWILIRKFDDEQLTIRYNKWLLKQI